MRRTDGRTAIPARTGRSLIRRGFNLIPTRLADDAPIAGDATDEPDSARRLALSLSLSLSVSRPSRHRPNNTAPPDVLHRVYENRRNRRRTDEDRCSTKPC